MFPVDFVWRCSRSIELGMIDQHTRFRLFTAVNGRITDPTGTTTGSNGSEAEDTAVIKGGGTATEAATVKGGKKRSGK